jgi:hypothetical protein
VINNLEEITRMEDMYMAFEKGAAETPGYLKEELSCLSP